MILKIINKTLDTLAGIVSGPFIALWQIPMGYVLLARTMREAKYSWFTTVLTLLTVAHIPVLLSFLTSLGFSLLYGPVLGFREGLTGIPRFFSTLHNELFLYALMVCTNDELQWQVTKGIAGMFEEFFNFAQFSLDKLFYWSETMDENMELKWVRYQLQRLPKRIIEKQTQYDSLVALTFAGGSVLQQDIEIALLKVQRLTEIFRQLEAWYKEELDKRQVTANNKLVDEIMALPTENSAMLPQFSDRELSDFGRAIEDESNPEKKQKNQLVCSYLRYYSENNCVEVNEEKQAIPPITVEVQQTIKTYAYSEFMHYVNQAKNQPVPIIIGDATLLADKSQVKIYRGYYLVDAKDVHNEITAWKSKKTEQYIEKLNKSKGTTLESKPEPISHSSAFFPSMTRSEDAKRVAQSWDLRAKATAPSITF